MQAVELYSVMRDVGVTPDLITGNAVMKALAELGQPDDALRYTLPYQKRMRLILISPLRRPPPPLRVIPTPAPHQSVLCLCSLPTRVFDGMIESGLAPDEVSFSTAIHACGRAGQWQKALSLLHAMEANQVRASSTRTSRFSSGPDP